MGVHLSAGDHVDNLARSVRHVGECQQRKRSRLAGPMTRRAIVEDYWSDVFVVREAGGEMRIGCLAGPVSRRRIIGG